jgi:hypothetical protein
VKLHPGSQNKKYDWPFPHLVVNRNTAGAVSENSVSTVSGYGLDDQG